jgi:hypothetical protein
MVDNRLHLALDRELAEGERIIWQAMQLARIEKLAFSIYFFAIPWTAFSLLWITLAVAGTASLGADGPGLIAWAFPLFGVPFVLVGLGMLAFPLLPLAQRGRVLYAVTNQRVLRLSLHRDLVIKAVPAQRIGLVERRESRDGTGILKLAVKIGRDSDGDARTEFFEIGRVADVMSAHVAISELATAPPPPPPSVINFSASSHSATAHTPPSPAPD